MKQITEQNTQQNLEEKRRQIGEQIKERRLKLGYSQDKLAEIAEMRKATLVDAELGRNVESNTLFTILSYLGGTIKLVWKNTNMSKN